MSLTNQDWFNEDPEQLLSSWKSAGIHTVKDVMKNGEILTKKEIENKIHTNLLWLHYFQLQTVLSNQRL